MLRVGSLCATTLYSVLGFSGTQSFHINVRKLVRFQHRDEKIPGRLCRESSLALSCLCACVRVWPRAISPHCGGAAAQTQTCRAARAVSPDAADAGPLDSGLFSYEKHICVAANGGS